MATTGTMESKTTVGDQDVTSQVSRSGETVHATIVNTYGDVVRASLDSVGRVRVSIEQSGQPAQVIQVNPRHLAGD